MFRFAIFESSVWLGIPSFAAAPLGPANPAATLCKRRPNAHFSEPTYGPQRKAPCPRCTSFLCAWNGIAVNLRERAATARSPSVRLIVYKRQRGFANPPFVFDLSGEYTRTYVNADDAMFQDSASSLAATASSATSRGMVNDSVQNGHLVFNGLSQSVSGCSRSRVGAVFLSRLRV